MTGWDERTRQLPHPAAPAGPRHLAGPGELAGPGPDVPAAPPPPDRPAPPQDEPAGPGDQDRADPGAAGAAAAAPAGEQSLGRASRTMAIASAASRLTGFLRSLAITAAVGLALFADGYNTANVLPNIVYELLLGGVLTSVVVPLLVHAQEFDADRGVAYAQRLLSLATAGLAVATLLATVAAPLLAAAYVPGAGGPKEQLTTVFAYLLLPQIFFYGLGAMIGAVLNTRGVFGPPAWAPVLNNVVVIAVAGLFAVVTRGRGLPTQAELSDPEVLLLGLGTTLGIVVQAVVLLPALGRSGFRWRWRLEPRGARLGEAGTLALWVLGYVAVSQVGYLVQVRLANAVGDGAPGFAVFVNASLLFQMPYGILGVSLLTALMPRMSRAAARGDRDRVVADLSLGGRLSALALLPVTALFMVLGPAIGTVVYGHGRAGVGAAREVGAVLAVSAFGLVPFAITMLQLRVFYALKDARPPTLVNVAMVAVRIVLSLGVAAALPDRHVVAGLAVATSVSYVVGAVLGEALLRRRLGRLDTRRLLRASGGFLVVSVLAGLAAWAVLAVIGSWLGLGPAASVVAVMLGSAAALAVLVASTLVWRSTELDAVLRGLRSRTDGSSGDGNSSVRPGRHRRG